jgi:hypothetical protein
LEGDEFGFEFGAEFGCQFGCEFQKGTVPEWERVTDWALLNILWGLREGVVLYWESMDCERDAVRWSYRLMCNYLAKEFQFGT